MSLLHTPVHYRRAQDSTLRVPVVLPMVQVKIDDQGLLELTVDREPYARDRHLTRNDLHQALDDITRELASPVKVEIHEPDDSTFTDIITPTTISSSGPTARSALSSGRARDEAQVSVSGSTGEVAGGGFEPDEVVAIAVVVAHQVADSDGTVRLRLPPALLADRSWAVVLLGRTSGTIAISDPSSGVAAGGAQ